MTSLTLDRLREVLHYSPETGAFTWRVTLSSRAPAGERAGTVNSYWGYVLIRVDRARYFAHRLAWFYMTGGWPSSRIDHRDTDRANNAWANLRLATLSQNGGNSRRARNNTTGFKGVSFHKASGKFRACIRVDFRQKSLGYFTTAEDAHAAYCKAAKVVFGEFARAA